MSDLKFTWEPWEDGYRVLDDNGGGVHVANWYEARLIAQVGRLTLALAEERAESLRQAEIARDALARIPNPDDLRTVCDEAMGDGDFVENSWHDAKKAVARLRATLPKEEPRG